MFQLDVPVGLSDLLRRVSLIDDRPDPPSLYSLLEQRHIAREQLRHSIIDRDVPSTGCECFSCKPPSGARSFSCRPHPGRGRTARRRSGRALAVVDHRIGFERPKRPIASSRRSGTSSKFLVPHMAVTSAPKCLANCTADIPTAPEAPKSTHCPLRIFPRLRKCNARRPSYGMGAASS